MGMTSSIYLISVSHFQNWGLSLSFSQLVPSFENGITRLVTHAWLRSPITGVSLYSLPVGEVWAGRCSVFYTIRAPFGQQDPNSTNIRRQPMRQAVISNYADLKTGWHPFSVLSGQVYPQRFKILWSSSLISYIFGDIKRIFLCLPIREKYEIKYFAQNTYFWPVVLWTTKMVYCIHVLKLLTQVAFFSQIKRIWSGYSYYECQYLNRIFRIFYIWLSSFLHDLY